MSSSFQMWSATPAAIAARGDLGCQDVGSVKLTHYPPATPRPKWSSGRPPGARDCAPGPALGFPPLPAASAHLTTARAESLKVSNPFPPRLDSVRASEGGSARMGRALMIGGVFLLSRDPPALAQWYRRYLGWELNELADEGTYYIELYYREAHRPDELQHLVYAIMPGDPGEPG